MATGKKAKRAVDPEGIAHIAATFNNTTVTITDMHGNTVAWGSSGKAGFKGSKKSTPFAATVAAEQAAREALSAGVKRVPVRVLPAGEFNAYTILRQKRLVLTKAALEELRKKQPAAK
mgnify:CR=1 FL=1